MDVDAIFINDCFKRNQLKKKSELIFSCIKLEVLFMPDVWKLKSFQFQEFGW